MESGMQDDSLYSLTLKKEELKNENEKLMNQLNDEMNKFFDTYYEYYRPLLLTEELNLDPLKSLEFLTNKKEKK